MADTVEKKDGNFNVALALDFSLFKAKLTAMFLKEKNGYRFLAIPTNQGETPEVTIEELINDIKKMTGADNTQAIQDTLTQAANDAEPDAAGNKIDPNNIRFSLKMVYLYVDTTKGDENKIVEYAFNINVVTTGLIPKAIEDFVTVDHLGIAIWNTERKAILEQMSLVNMDEYLGLETSQETPKDDASKDDKTKDDKTKDDASKDDKTKES